MRDESTAGVEVSSSLYSSSDACSRRLVIVEIHGFFLLYHQKMEIDSLLLSRLKGRPVSDRKKAFALQLQKNAADNIADLAVALALTTEDVEECFNYALQPQHFIPAPPHAGPRVKWVPIFVHRKVASTMTPTQRAGFHSQVKFSSHIEDCVVVRVVSIDKTWPFGSKALNKSPT